MIYVSPDYETLLKEKKLLTTQDFFRFFQDGEVVSASSTSCLWRKQLGKDIVYLKKYYSFSLRYFCRKSKGMREYLAYRFFLSSKIPSPDLIYFAEKRFLGNLRWSCILTKGIENTMDLFAFFQKKDTNPAFRMKIMENLANIASRMHMLGFFHKDFKFRNILLSLYQEDVVHLYLIDCPKSIIKKAFSFSDAIWDLVTLYKHALFLCHPEEWQYFLDIYSQGIGKNKEELASFVLHKYKKKFG